MKTTYCLVYRAGIANVFEEKPYGRGEQIKTDRNCEMQADFRSCETFCRGLRKMGATVRVAWCNEAGDITDSFWRFSKFELAPFHDYFATDFVKLSHAI